MVQPQPGIHLSISANLSTAPISLGGYLALGNGIHKVGIKQIQLEQVRSYPTPPRSDRPRDDI